MWQAWSLDKKLSSTHEASKRLNVKWANLNIEISSYAQAFIIYMSICAQAQKLSFTQEQARLEHYGIYQVELDQS